MDPFATEVTRQVGRRVRRRRRHLDLTQEELALRSGVHRTQFTLIENGRRMPKLHTLIKIAIVLDVSPGQLLEGIRPEPVGGAPSVRGEADDG
jgi:transcriptional regulator with XRE-family HTH domain